MSIFTRFTKTLLTAFLVVFLFTNSTKAQTTLVAGDIAFSGYVGHGTGPTTADEFSFVLLKNITSGTVINFTENGWLSTNVFRTGENTITWTSNSALVAGQEITIVGTTPSLASGIGTAGIVTGTAFALSANGDQILAYQGTIAAPTFITAIHMNVYDAVGNPPDPSTTTAAAWDGIANTTNSSALPTGLTTGVNAIWIGTQSNINSEKDNARFICAGDLSTVASIKGLIYDQTKWQTSDNEPVGFALPTGCSYIAAIPAPSFTTQPTSSSICAGANTSFTIVATGAISYQWQVDNGGGFTNISNDAIYSNATTTTLNITAAPFGFNGYLYRCVAVNGTGPTNSTSATLTVTALPTTPTLLAKTPNTTTVADGTPVSATFNAGSGGTGCADDFRYTTNGGASYLPYTPGSNISTTGLAAAGGTVTIEGRRANCTSSCQGAYAALASWIVTPLPAGATTLNAGDIAFSGYTSSTANSDFSFVLLRNIGPGTVINFTDNGWLSANVFRTGETTVTWTSNAAYSAGTEIMINALTSTLTSGGSAGTVTGTALSLSVTGDQILAYRGTAASPTFISAIHMNVYTVANGDPTTTSAAAWDGAANTIFSSALPTGLTTGTNAIWIGTAGDINSEFDNAKYGTCSNPATFGSIATLRAALNNQANWTKDNNVIPSFVLPTGCSYLGIGASPSITTQPTASSICVGANTSFTIVATGATTYQWQVDNGGGFTNLANDATYSNLTTPTLNITAATIGLNGYLYRCITTNGSGSTNSNSAALTVTILPVNPILLVKTPAAINVADGTPVSATFTAGSGGTGCADDYRYTTDGGATYLPYTAGSNISTTGLAAASGTVFIEGRRANCTSSCQGAYSVLASWTVTPLPASATTLNAGDIAFSGYNSSTGSDEFSFVLLKNIGVGTVINFTNNGWLSTNVFRTGEETVTWTAPAGGMIAGTEIKITGLTATKSGGGAAGTVTGTAISLGVNGDQVLAYRGTAVAPTFISAIHMNVYSTTNADPVTTTAAAWDGTANTANASALPTGLTTGVNAIWIGTQGDINTEFDNAKYGTCANPATLGAIATLRAALNNQANWSRNNGTGFILPTGCNYLSALVPSISITGTPLTAFTSCIGSVSAEQSFSASGSALTANITITAPTGFEISTITGSGFAASLTLTQSGGTVNATTIFVRMAASATGTPSGNITLASTGVTTVNVAVSGTVNSLPTAPTITAGGATTFCVGDNVVLTSSSATGNVWSTGATTPSITVTTAGTYTVTVTSGGCTSAPSAGTIVTVNPIPATPTITSGGTTTFCTGGSVVLTSSSATGNTWSTGATTPSITVTTGGTYTVTVTSSGCTSAASAGTTVTIDALPTTAAAGVDLTACINPGSATMAANVPTVGTGAWSQVPGGPATAIIFTTGSATSNIGGLTTAGVYTFVWTISNGACPPSRDTMTITVNGNPVAFTVSGGGVFCPSTQTLSGPVNPNYTYVWERSLSGIANPNSFTAFGGTTNTQVVNTSGNYRLRVTNQFGCSTTDTASVSMADYVFNGSLATGDLQQTGRVNRFAIVSTCAAPKACPGIFVATGARLYDAYTITNPRSVPVCATIGIASGCGVNMFSVAYSGSFDPNAPCTNFLADPGSSFPNVGYYEATIPANGTIVVVVHEVNTGAGCANYQLTVDVPRDLSAITATPPSVVFNGTSSLAAPIAGSYLWSPGGGTTQSITTAPITAATTYYATMGYGNAGCTRVDSVTVNLSCTTPTITCPANISLSNTTGTCGRVVTYTTTTGGTPAPTITYAFTGATTASGSGDGSGSTFNVGTTNVTVTVTNVCGNTSCSFTVTINDTQAPTVTVGTIASCYPTVAAAQTAALIATSATDNCPAVLTETASTVGTCSAVVTIRTTDAAGNFTDVTYNTRIDNTAPTVTVGTIGSCYPTVAAAEAAALAAASATDNCPGALVEIASTVGTCSAVVTVTTTDGCGNATAITYNTRIDNTAPTVTIGTIGSCYSTVAAAEAAALAATSATDNCPGALVEIASTVGTCSAVVTVTTTDGCGNATAVNYNTRIDNTAPTVTVGTIGSCYPTVALAEAAALAATSATDNCPGTLVEIASTVGTCSAVVTVTTTDGCGNSTAVTYNTRIDNTAPTVTVGTIGSCYPTVAAAEAAALAATSATDNCPGALAETANTVGTCSAVITVTTTDGCGNATAVTYNTRIDNTAPTVTVGTIGSCYPTVAAAEAAALAATTATDNCPGALTEVASTVGTCSAVVTVTTTDGCGNAIAVTYNTRVDNIAPSVTCPAPITVCGAAGVPAVNIASVTATDNCTGAIIITHQGDVSTPSTTAPYNIVRTYRATDGCGNFTDCTQIITVNPIATVNAITNQVVCNNAPTTAVTFSSTATGGTIVYNWTNNTTSIGLAGSGSGNIPSFIATNTSNAPVTATITVTPSYTNAGVTCIGTQRTFTITVNPTATVLQIGAGGNIFINGTLSLTDPVYNRPLSYAQGGTCALSGVGTAVHFKTHTFTLTTASNVTVSLVPADGASITPAGADTYLQLIGPGGFVPTATCTNSIAANDDAVGSLSRIVTTTPLPAGTYTVVVSSFANTPTGAGALPWTYTLAVLIPATGNTALTNQVVCNNSPTTAVNFTSPTTGGTIVYNWTNNTPSIGLASSGSGNIASFNAVNTTTAPLVATITVTPSYTNAGVTCVGTPSTYTYTVNPTATINAVTSQVICNASPTTAVTFSSPTTGGTIAYNWTNNTPSIGLAASGSGNIASFNAVNIGTAPVVATITVTPSYTNAGVTCVGTPITYTYTVNPTATITAVANQVVCNNSPTTAVAFTSPTTGGTIVYNWTNNTTSIGLAASGVGNIASFNATNTTTAPVVATITVTPSYTNAGVTCVGTPRTFTITVNPTPIVNVVANQSLCNGASTAGVNFTSPTTGGTTVYNWTNNTTSIGLAASGSGNISSFVAVNVGTVPVVATISIIASYTNGGVTCTGPTQTFTITVNPTPIVTLAPFAAICKNAAPLTLTGGSPVNGTGGGVGIYLINGVAQTVFNPANYAPGFHTILYQFTNSFGCVRSATQQIQVYPIHTVEITLAPNTGVRPGVPVTVIATVSPVDNYTYTWTKNNVLIPSTTTDRITVLGNDAGNYKVTVTAPTGCVVVSDNAFTSSAISSQLFIFPNPNTGLFNVSYNNGDANLTARTLSVYDERGAKVFSKGYSVNVPYGNMVVDIRNKARGQYYVLLIDSNGKKLASATVQKL